MKNLTLITRKMPVMDFKNCQNISVEGLNTPSPESAILHFSGSKTNLVSLKNVGISNAVKQLVVDNEVSVGAVRLDK